MCGLAGMMFSSGRRVSGEAIIRAMSNMRDRGNGLGGGFAAYGIYPEYKDAYAFHVMYYSTPAKDEVDAILDAHFDVLRSEPIPTDRSVVLPKSPELLWRYFLVPSQRALDATGAVSESDMVMQVVMQINSRPERDAFVFSSGKNMGAFKAVGYPEDVGRFYRLHEYEAYIWTGHSRFPTNTQGWWGGAHPFTLLDWSVVHNGEISSYGINKRYLEMFGYRCTLHTDTEVIAYLLDLLIRRHGLSIEDACEVMASPFWKDLDRSNDEKRRILRIVYSSALVNGPFAIVFAHSRGMVGFNDRVKLRPMVAAKKDDALFLASEEAAILELCEDPDEIWSPPAGKPVVGWVKDGVA
ncbi:MAG: class II glutamine amidotransferase [Armatimonadota bacterium]